MTSKIYWRRRKKKNHRELLELGRLNYREKVEELLQPLHSGKSTYRSLICHCLGKEGRLKVLGEEGKGLLN